MPWKTLQLAPTRDEREIRRAYARALKSRQHEEDAAWFAELRNAYEHALYLCRQADAEQSEDQDGEPEEGQEQQLSEDFSTPGTLEERPARPDLDAAEMPTPILQDADIRARHVHDKPFPDNSLLKQQLGISGDEDPEAVIGNMLTAMRDALADNGNGNVTHGMDFWQQLADYPPMASLLYRNDVSPIVADMLARNWPKAQPIWLKAKEFFHWEPPTYSDQSMEGQALRWLFETSEMEAEQEARRHILRPTRTAADTAKAWADFAAECARCTPDPLKVLEDNKLKRRLRYTFHRRTRELMALFLDRVSELDFVEQVGHHRDMSWWREALSAPFMTAWPVFAGVVAALGLFGWVRYEFLAVLYGCLFAMFCHRNIATPLHNWHASGYQEYMTSTVKRLGGLPLFLLGGPLMLYGLESYDSWGALPGLLLLCGGFVWVVLSAYPRIVEGLPRGVSQWWKLTYFALACCTFFVALPFPHDTTGEAMNGIASLALASWMFLIDGSAWALIRENIGKYLAGIRPWMLGCLGAGLGIVDIVAGPHAYLHAPLGSLTLFISTFGWSYIRDKGWSFPGNAGLLFVVAVVFTSFAGLAKMAGYPMLLLVPLIALISTVSFSQTAEQP